MEENLADRLHDELIDGAIQEKLDRYDEMVALLKGMQTPEGHYDQCLAGQRGYGQCSYRCEQLRALLARIEGGR